MSDYLQALRSLAPIFAFVAVIAAFAAGATYWKFNRDMDAAWVDPLLTDAEAEWDEWVQQALEAGSETPILDATAAHIAAQLSAHLDDEWKRIAGGAA